MNKQIKIFSVFASTIGFLISGGMVNAVVSPNINVRNTQINEKIIQTITVTPEPTTTITLKPVKRVEIKIILKKTNAIKEIDRRLASLGKLTDKINSIKKITSTQKETLLAQVQIEITKLENLKVKINAETDATALQEEKKSIIDSYRIYALFMPKIEIAAHADKIITIADEMSGKTTDQGLLKIISDSKAKAQSALDLVMPLVPEDYPNNKVTLQKARDLLREARTSLNTVYTTLKSEN